MLCVHLHRCGCMQVNAPSICVLQAKLQHLIVSKSLQEDVYTHLCVFNPITNTKAVVDIHDLDDDDEADLLSKIHQADRIFSTVLLPIIQEMKGSSPQVTSKDVGEFFYERDQPDSIKVGSKVFHSKQEKFGIVKKQLSPEKVLVHWEGDAAKVGDKNVDIKYVYPVPILSPRQPVQAGQRVVIIAGKRVDLVGRTGKLVQLNTMKGKVRLADGEEVQMRLCYLHAMDELVCLTEAQRSWHVSDAEAERFEMELELDLIQQENVELCVG